MRDFIEEPEHIFECTIPTLGDDFPLTPYQHPVLPIICYEPGVLFPTYDNITIGLNKSSTVLTVKREGNWEGILENAIAKGYNIIGMNRTPQIRVAGVPQMAYECYHQVILGHYENVIFENLNPYDLRISNLRVGGFPIGTKELAQRNLKLLNFRNRTISEMDRRYLKAVEKGMDGIKYIKSLGIPLKYYNLWEKNTTVLDNEQGV